MRSFFATAACLSLIHTTVARVPHSFRDVEERDALPEQEVQPKSGLFDWVANLFRRQSSDEVCFEDAYNVFAASGEGQILCQELMNYPAVTVVEDYTPIRSVQ